MIKVVWLCGEKGAPPVPTLLWEFLTIKGRLAWAKFHATRISTRRVRNVPYPEEARWLFGLFSSDSMTVSRSQSAPHGCTIGVDPAMELQGTPSK